MWLCLQPPSPCAHTGPHLHPSTRIFPSISMTDSAFQALAIPCFLRGAWVAQWVKASAFGSSHDPRILGSV
uniref:Uncharacterized protein n=1 Tax=Mustela putorius furo TaxID=9669 RepID=M3XP68_MUSPF